MEKDERIVSKDESHPKPSDNPDPFGGNTKILSAITFEIILIWNLICKVRDNYSIIVLRLPL